MNKNYLKFLPLVIIIVAGTLYLPSLISDINEEKLRNEEVMRVTNCLDYLKNTSSYYEAVFSAEEIRKAVAVDTISWEELGINESDLDEIVLNLQRPKAKKDLAILKNTTDYYVALACTQDIQEAVTANAISWEELEINESDLDKFLFNLQGPKAKDSLQYLKTSIDHDMARRNVNEIQSAVKANATSWEELEINESDLDKFVLDAHRRETEADLELLFKSHRTNKLLASILVENIKEAVAANVTSWEELRISESDLDEFALNNE